jgi:hypothetical protein
MARKPPPTDRALWRLRYELQQAREKAEWEARHKQGFDEMEAIFARKNREREQAQKPAIGHPREYNRDEFITIAEGFMRESVQPRSAAALADKVAGELQLRKRPIPSPRWLEKLLGPTFKSMKIGS